MEGFLLQATIYLGAMVVAVPLSVRLGLGSVLGYLIAGIIIGPALGLVGSETEDLQHVAEFGVVLMLFVIGLELAPGALWEMRQKLLGQGGAQIVLTVAALAGLAMLTDVPWQTALTIGLVLTLSSTAIVLQTLSEKALITTPGGRSSFSVLLMQDIAVIPMLAILPLLALPATMQANEDGSIRVGNGQDDHHHTLSLVDGLPAWGVTLVTIASIVAVIVVGHYLLHYLFRFVHLARLREMYTAFALVVVVGIAFLMVLVGLSPALGAFIAGVVLANSEFRHELEANIEPFKGLLLGLFFITVGAGINFAFLSRNLGDVMAITVLVIITKGAILYAIGWFAGLRERNLWLFTLGLAQAGEFGFVLISFAAQSNALNTVLSQKLLLVVALSMLLTPLLFILYEFLAKRGAQSGGGDLPEFDDIDQSAPVIIAGLGRFGQVVHRMLRVSGLKTVLLDADIETIRVMRRFGLRSYFGDPTRPELLHAAGLDQAKVLVVAINNKDQAIKLVRYVKSVRPEISIVARAHDRLHVYELYAAGADHIVREVFDSSLRAARYVLEDMGLTDYEAHELEAAFYHHDRHNLRELASLWKAGVPVEKNEAYLARAREMNASLDVALTNELEDGPAETPSPNGRARRGDAGALSGLPSRRAQRQTKAAGTTSNVAPEPDP